MFPAPPAGAWTAIARDPVFGGPVVESNVVEFTLVWLDQEGAPLSTELVKLSEQDAMPLTTLNAALKLYTENVLRRERR